MPYIGRELDRGNYLKLDDISSSFDGSTTTFNLTNGGNAFYPGSAFSILVVLAGVVQEPEAAYQINQAQITFASAPLAGDQFFCITLGQALGVNTPANGSVNGAQLAKPFNYDNYFYLDDANNRVGVGTATPMTPLHVEGTGRFTDLTVTGDLTVEGTTSTLDTVVTEVDKLEVLANNSTVAVAVTQSGSGDAATFEGGNVGIGTNNAEQKLHVSGGIGTNIQVQQPNGSLYLGSSGSTRFGLTTGANIIQSTSTDFGIGSQSGHNLIFGTNNARRLSITDQGDFLIQWNNGNFLGSYYDADYYMGLSFGANRRELYIDNRSNDTRGDIVFRTVLGQSDPTEKLRITSGGNIGIGNTDTPQSLLEVFGTSPIIRSKHSTSQKYTQINHDGTDGYLDWSSGELIFRGANNAERLRVDSNGNIGIGTDNPNYKLDVDGDIRAVDGTAPKIIVADNFGAQRFIFGYTQSPVGHNLGSKILADGLNIGYYTRLSQNGSHIFYTNNSGSDAERVRITSAGNVGIGTDNPTVKLVSTGLIKIQGEPTNVSNLIFTRSDRSWSINNETDFRIYTSSGTTDSPSSLVLAINGSGQVGIGTNNPSWGVSSGLIVGDGASSKGITIFSNSANVGDLAFADATSGTARYRGLIRYNHSDNSLALRTNSSERLRINSTGLVGIGTDSPDFDLHLFRTGDTTLVIESDRPNADENANPKLVFRQDGGVSASAIGMNFDSDGIGNDLFIANSIASGSIRFLTGSNNGFTNASEALRITPAGLVGIGTDNPLNGLDVNQSEGRLRVNRFSHLLMQNKNDSTTDYWGISARNGGELDIGYGTPDGNGLIGGDKLTITSAGDVGIGTATPDKKLRVEGDARVTGTFTIGEASTVIDGSVEYPSSRPTLDLNFAATKVLDDRITFTRDGVGTYIDENGILKYASNNTPRFDHDPVTGESLGLLIEESRTNILYGTPSQSNTVNTYNLYNSLTGEYNATRLAKNSTTNTQSHGSWSWDGNLSTTSFVISVFVKKINHASFFMQVVSSGVGDNLYVYYNIDTGVTSFTDFNSPGNLTVTRSIENYPDGWFRLVARVEGFSNAALHSGFRLGFAHPTNNSQQYIDSSDEVLVFGAQAEVGDFVTSYIPTHESTTSVTRSADLAKITGTNFSSWFNNTEGTIDVSYKFGLDTTANRIFQIGKSTTTNDFLDIVSASGGGLGGYFYVNYGGVNQGSGPLVTNSAHTNSIFKVVAAYKENDVQAVNNKTTTVFTDNTVNIPSGLDELYFCQYNGTDQLNGHLQTAKYYPKRLPLAQLRGLVQQ